MSSVGLQPDAQVQSQAAGFHAFLGKHVYLLGCLIFFLCIVLYLPVRHHPFVNYDDNIYVIDNTHVQGGLTSDTVTWAFTTYDGGNWHPLTWLSHALDVELFELHPGGHHQTSVLLHAVNSVLLFWILLRATGYAGRSFMVATLFAIHPINVESVVWIAERKTVLSMFFCLLALGAYRWYVANPKALRYFAVAVFFALGLMAKPQIITFPFVLLLWDYWPLRRLSLSSNEPELKRSAPGVKYPQKTFRALVIEKIPLFAIAVASAVMTMKAQRAGGAILSFDASPLAMRLSNGLVSYVKYLMKALWPAKLAPMYPHPGNSLRALQVYGALLVLLIVSFLVVEHRRRRYLLVGWLWFLGTLVPMIGLVQVGRQAMADRYAYLPLIGIFIMICWGTAEWSETAHLPVAVLPVASALALVGVCVVTRAQIDYWADNVTLWTHTVEVTPPNYIAQDNLGGALLERKQMEEAIGHFRTAVAIHPVDPISTFNIGFYEQEHGDLYGAIDYYRKAIILTTSRAVKIKAWNDMGIAYRKLGDPQQAHECFEAARKLAEQ
ncbi:MAG TPA: tetratricopeptide repeat protein [Terriglobales bacterium]|nr:tetratricopeptide repeat protein [Terriglobales bacterium]